MAGIIASSASVPMVAGDTSVSKVQSGYVVGEQIALSVTPAGAGYVWALAIPSGSAPARSNLNGSSGASNAFRPDVHGEYVVTCVVDGGTSYVIRCTVAPLTASTIAGAIHLIPIADANVPTPSTGKTLYLSSPTLELSLKDISGTIERVNTT